MKNYPSFFIILFSFLGITINSSGQITFQKTYGELNDGATSVKQTADGGYILVGHTDNGNNPGDDNVYLIKTNVNGDTLWTKVYGGGSSDVGNAVQQTADGGYIIAGTTFSFGEGGGDVYLIKTDANGDTLWTKTYGGSSDDYGSSVQQTADGGYIILGSSHSFNAINDDVYLIKTDANGGALWTKTLGGSGSDEGYSIQQSSDGGYIITGGTYGFGAGNWDVYLIKTDSTGAPLWSKTYGGPADDYGLSIQQTTDGGYIIAGYSYSFSAGNEDIYLIKTDAFGNALWTESYGGTGDDVGYSVQQTNDGGYIVAGYTNSFSGLSADAYLIKTDALGDTLWTKTFGGTNADFGYSAQQTTDGGYIITGSTTSFLSGVQDVYLIKTDANGNSGCNQTNPATIVTTPATIVTSPATIVTSPATIVTSPATIVGSGGVVNTQCITTGIQSANNNQQTAISVSPNPASSNSEITFTYPSLGLPSEIVLNNIDGKEVGRYALPLWSSVQHLKLPKLAEGVYVARLISNSQYPISNIRFVVE